VLGPRGCIGLPLQPPSAQLRGRLLPTRRRHGSRRTAGRARRARRGAPDAGRRLVLRCWHSVFFTCPLLDSRKKLVFVACDKKQKNLLLPPGVWCFDISRRWRWASWSSSLDQVWSRTRGSGLRASESTSHQPLGKGLHAEVGPCGSRASLHSKNNLKCARWRRVSRLATSYCTTHQTHNTRSYPNARRCYRTPNAGSLPLLSVGLRRVERDVFQIDSPLIHARS
jgi:hypothetical protein